MKWSIEDYENLYPTLFGKSLQELYLMRCTIRYHLYNLKNLKTPLEECYF